MSTPQRISLPAEEALFEVECRIARRADELIRQPGVEASPALECWLQAEREIWHDVPGRTGRKD